VTATTLNRNGSSALAALSSVDRAKKKAELQKRANSLCWVLSPDFLTHWAKYPNLAKHKLSRSRRIVLALLAWYGDADGYAWPKIESDLVERSGLGRSTVFDVLRWHRNDLKWSGRPKKKTPVRDPAEKIAKAIATSGTWTHVVWKKVDVPGYKRPQDREVREPHAETNALVAKFKKANLHVRGRDFIEVARTVLTDAERFAALTAGNAPAPLVVEIPRLRDALADYEQSNGVEHRRADKGPVYVAFRAPQFKGARVTVWAWAKGLPLDDLQRLVLHTLLTRTTGKLRATWLADAELASIAGVSVATWKRGLAALGLQRLVTIRKVPKGGRLPNGMVTTTWRAVRSVNVERLARLAKGQAEADEALAEGPELSESASDSERVDVQDCAGRRPEVSEGFSGLGFQKGPPEGGAVLRTATTDTRAHAHEGHEENESSNKGTRRRDESSKGKLLSFGRRPVF
jgi:hypothetical protein